jgi:hypothetical protein
MRRSWSWSWSWSWGGRGETWAGECDCGWLAARERDKKREGESRPEIPIADGTAHKNHRSDDGDDDEFKNGITRESISCTVYSYLDTFNISIS